VHNSGTITVGGGLILPLGQIFKIHEGKLLIKIADEASRGNITMSASDKHVLLGNSEEAFTRGVPFFISDAVFETPNLMKFTVHSNPEYKLENVFATSVTVTKSSSNDNSDLLLMNETSFRDVNNRFSTSLEQQRRSVEFKTPYNGALEDESGKAKGIFFSIVSPIYDTYVDCLSSNEINLKELAKRGKLDSAPARNDNPPSIVDTISDESQLTLYAKSHPDWRVRVDAINKLKNPVYLAEIIKSNAPWDIREMAVKRTTDDNLLIQIAMTEQDINVRKAAIEKLTDQIVLAQIAKRERDRDIQMIVLSKLTDQEALGVVASTDSDFDLREIAVKKISDQAVLVKILKTIIKESSWKSTNVREIVVSKVTDQTILAEIAKTDSKSHVRVIAVEKLTDQKLLAYIAERNSDVDMQKAAIKNLVDKNLIGEVAKSSNNSMIRWTAIEKLSDQAVLADIAQNGYHEDTRLEAINKLTDLPALVKIVMSVTDSDYNLLYRAFDKLNDQILLAEVAKAASSYKARMMAIDKLTDYELLNQIAKRAPDKYVREAAKERRRKLKKH
jgi:hypothetical protein